MGNRQTKIFLWKTDKVEMEVSHTFEISMGDKKKKSYGLLKSSPKGGGGVRLYQLVSGKNAPNFNFGLFTLLQFS